MVLSEPPVLGELYLSIYSHSRPREGGIMMELWWNCLELFFRNVSYDFQTIPDEFQIPVHMQISHIPQVLPPGTGRSRLVFTI